MTESDKNVRYFLRQIALAIVDTVKESMPDGCPGGTLYLGLMQYNFSLTQFEGIMEGLVKAGRLVKRGDLYFTR